MILNDLVWVLGGRIVNILISLLTIRLSTSILSPDEYGFLAILISFQAFTGLFMINPVGQYVNRNMHEWSQKKILFARLKKYRTYIVLASLCGGLSICLWSLTRSFEWLERLMYILLLFFMVLSATWNATFIGFLNMLGYRPQSVLSSTLTAILGLFCSLVLVTLFDEAGWAWFAGQSIGMGIGALAARYMLRKYLPDQETCDQPFLDYDTIRSYVFPLAIATGFMWWLISGYRLLLEMYWGFAVLGMVAVGFGLATQLWGVVETLAIQLLYPFYYRRISDGSLEDSQGAFSDLVNILGPIYLVLASAAIITAPALLKLFVSPSYQHVVLFLQLGICFELARVGGNLAGSAAQVNRRMKILIIPYISGGAFMTLALVYIGKKQINIYFAVIALVISSFIMFFLMVLQVKKAIVFKIDKIRWLLTLMLLLISSISSCFLNLEGGGFFEATLLIVVVSFFVLAILFALLWNYPATKRLLSVQLFSRGS